MKMLKKLLEKLSPMHSLGQFYCYIYDQRFLILHRMCGDLAERVKKLEAVNNKPNFGDENDWGPKVG